MFYLTLQASAAKQIITALFWVVTQLGLPKTPENVWSHLQESNIFCLYSCSLRIGTICLTEKSIINYHHLLRNNQDFHGSLLTLNYMFHIAHPNYAVQCYLITIQYLAGSTFIKHFITQFSLDICYFVAFSSRHFFNTPLIKHSQILLYPQYKLPNFPPNQRQQ